MTDLPDSAIAPGPPLPVVTRLDPSPTTRCDGIGFGCRRHPGIAVDGVPYCARHAGSRLLSLMLQRGGR